MSAIRRLALLIALCGVGGFIKILVHRHGALIFYPILAAALFGGWGGAW